MDNLFSERLKELIFDNKLTVKQFAAEIDTSFSAVYRWIREPVQITRKYIIRIADYFKVSIEYLIGRSDNEHPIIPKVCPKFSEQLRKVMKEKDISTYKLRSISRFDSMYFQKWDRGEEPGVSLLIELSNIFDCTIDYLIGRE